MKPVTFIGITLKHGLFRVVVRRTGQVQANLCFPSDKLGTEMLTRYVAGMGEPVRLAIAVGAATLAIAFSLGEPQGARYFSFRPR